MWRVVETVYKTGYPDWLSRLAIKTGYSDCSGCCGGKKSGNSTVSSVAVRGKPERGGRVKEGGQVALKLRIQGNSGQFRAIYPRLASHQNNQKRNNSGKKNEINQASVYDQILVECVFVET